MLRLNTPIAKPLLNGSSTPVLNIASAAPAVMNQALNPTTSADTTRTTPPSANTAAPAIANRGVDVRWASAPHAAAPRKLAAPTPSAMKPYVAEGYPSPTSYRKGPTTPNTVCAAATRPNITANATNAR